MRLSESRILKLTNLCAMLALAGCSTAPKLSAPAPVPVKPHPPTPVAKAPPGAKPDLGTPLLPPANSGHGAYYQDDGPGDAPPPDLADVPDADVRNDPLLPYSNRPYVVFGKTYTPITGNQPFTQIGVASWYGKKFHGQKTSSGEIYDMYKMTAAHPTLPIPSYARLTNMVSGAVVVVRINDRGPFHANRAIDVSYTAALKLGLLAKGSHELLIERILPAEIDRMLAAKAAAPGIAPARLSSQSVQAKARLASQQSSQQTPQPAPPLMLTPSLTLGQASAPQVAPDAVASDVLASSSGGTAVVKGGFYLQLGAYSRAENAEAVRNRLNQTDSGLSGLEVVQGGSVHRLFSGPFATRQDALQAAQLLPSSLGLKPIVVQR